MSRSWRRSAAGLAVAVVLVLAGCGVGSGVPAEAGTPTPEITLPPCATAAPVAIPDAFPVTLPLPPGSVVTVAEAAGSDVVLQLLAPLSIAELGAFLEDRFPDVGFQLGEGEAEPDELEQAFAGNGLAGQVTARHSSDCPDALSVRIAIRSG